jgi:hypothetical protein
VSHRSYSDDTKRRVLDVYQQVGLSEAERRCGVNRTTILRWANELGIDRERISGEVGQRNARAAAVASSKRARETEERRERIADRLGKLSEAALLRELELIAGGGFQPSDLQMITNSRMKAIQQGELLAGQPTSRVVVEAQQAEVLAGVATAIQGVLPLIVELAGQEAADRVSEEIARQLRNVAQRVSDGDVLELEAADVSEDDQAGEEAA